MYILIPFDFLATAHFNPFDGRRKESTWLLVNRQASKHSISHHRISLVRRVSSGARPVTSVTGYILSVKLNAYSLTSRRRWHLHLLGWGERTLAPLSALTSAPSLLEVLSPGGAISRWCWVPGSLLEGVLASLVVARAQMHRKSRLAARRFVRLALLLGGVGVYWAKHVCRRTKVFGRRWRLLGESKRGPTKHSR